MRKNFKCLKANQGEEGRHSHGKKGLWREKLQGRMQRQKLFEFQWCSELGEKKPSQLPERLGLDLQRYFPAVGEADVAR